MIIDQTLLARACNALCAPLHLGQLWRDGGPTDKAVELRAMRRLGKRERTMVHLAWCLWNASGDIHASDLLDLDGPDQRAIGGLLISLQDGSVAVEAWITGQHERARRALEKARAEV